MTTEGRRRAAARAAAEAARAGLSDAALAEKAGVDPGTVRDFLAGERWPREATRTKLERALGVQAGLFRLVELGIDDAPDEDPVEQAIKGSALTRANQHKLIGAYYDLLDEQREEATG